MRLIDLDNDILVEPNKKIIVSTREENSKILTPSNFNMENNIEGINRRDFLIYLSVAMAGTVIPTQTKATPFFAAYVLEALVVTALNILKNLIKKLAKKALFEMEKKGIYSLSNATRHVQNYIIDVVVEFLEIYYGEKISRELVRKALVKYHVLEKEIEAIWGIESKNKANITFSNPTNNTIRTKLEMYIRDNDTNQFDKKHRLLRYKRAFLLDIKSGGNLDYDIDFADLPKEGVKKVIVYGNEKAKALKITSSGNICVVPVFV